MSLETGPRPLGFSGCPREIGDSSGEARLACAGVAQDSLRGKLLIASPALGDPNFERTVVLITEHGEDGAMGIVLNRPSESEVAGVIPELEPIAGEEPIFVGGPVQPEALVVLGEFSDPEKAAWIVVADVGLVSAQSDLDELPDGAAPRPRLRRLLRLGARAARGGDRRGRLDRRGAPAGGALPGAPDTMWSDVLERMGGEYAIVARMPEDPSVN